LTPGGGDDRALAQAFARDSRRAGLIFAATALFWILALEIGQAYDLPRRVRAFLDLMALAGFGWGLWLTYRLWRLRQGERGRSNRG